MTKSTSVPKRGRGRPPLPLPALKRTRSRPVSVFFTADEFARLKELAGKQPLSGYLREKGLGLA
jgi:hypothetical protein